jgi:hypothetical protein
MNRLRGRGTPILGSALVPQLKKKALNSLVAVQDSYLSTKVIEEFQFIPVSEELGLVNVFCIRIFVKMSIYNLLIMGFV